MSFRGIARPQASLAKDVMLLRQSADRCRDILRSMGASGRDDLLIRSAPICEVLNEAVARIRGAPRGSSCIAMTRRR